MNNDYDLKLARYLDALDIITENMRAQDYNAIGKLKGILPIQITSVSHYLAEIDMKAKDLLSQGHSIEKVKKEITTHIEALLAVVSRKIKGGALDCEDQVSKDARKAIWTSIRQCTSKQDLLFEGTERPQAKRGENWLVTWSEPQIKVWKQKSNKKKS